MALRLITELVEDVRAVITEANGRKDYFIEGPFLQTEIKNRNGRVYPLSVMEREVARYTKELISEQRALGELGHPDGPAINLPLVSHKIISLEQSGNDFHGKAKILDTPNGKIVKSLLDEGVKLGVSSRGLGSITATPQGNMVGEDFMLATAADIVSDPSAPNAFVRGIMEGKEWVWNNGALREADVAAIYHGIAHAPKKKTDDRRLVEAAAFRKFLQAIRVSVTEDWGDAGDDEDARDNPDDEMQEDDITTSDHETFYQSGKLAFEVTDEDGGYILSTNGKSYKTVEAAVKAFMKADGFWPNCWFISDHGNAHLMDLNND